MQKANPEPQMIIIRPKVGQFKFLDRVNPQDLVTEGERATKEALADIRMSFDWFQQLQRRIKRPSLPGVINPCQDIPERKINL